MPVSEMCGHKGKAKAKLGNARQSPKKPSEAQ